MNVGTVKCLCSTRGGGEAKVQVRELDAVFLQLVLTAHG